MAIRLITRVGSRYVERSWKTLESHIRCHVRKNTLYGSFFVYRASTELVEKDKTRRKGFQDGGSKVIFLSGSRRWTTYYWNRWKLSAPPFSRTERQVLGRFFSDANLGAAGGYCPELNFFWRDILPATLTSELTRKTESRENCAITVNLLELCGMMMTACVIHIFLEEEPVEPGAVDPVVEEPDCS